MRAFWEYNISFKDPASVYAYHMFSTHHGIMWYIIIILILVYWCLYQILRDFTRSISISQFSGFSRFYNFLSKIPVFQEMCDNLLCFLPFVCSYYYGCMVKLMYPLLDWYLCCIDIVHISILLNALILTPVMVMLVIGLLLLKLLIFILILLI